MGIIKVETDELTACAKRYKELADRFNEICNSIIAKMGEYDNVWKGSFTQDFEEKEKSFKNNQELIYKSCTTLADFINGAVQKYIDVDRGLADKSTIGTADYPDNVKPSMHIYSDEELNTIYNNSTQTTGIKYNPNGTYSCAWLTKRKAAQHGFVPSWSGNGNQVYGNIQSTNDYNATKYPGANCLNDMIANEGQPITDIVISFNPNHVIYIDKIVDGKVYFSDNRNPAKMLIKDINSFPYQGYTAVGCAHLTKK